MKIKRDKLLNDLQDFALRGNGVVIGSPGVGKTYILKELRRNLESAEIPELLLPIDQLGDGTDETLKHELLIEENLIEFLKSIPLSYRKGIILFDAFDAARSEVARNNFLQLIRRAIQELDKWNIVVTVRTYDAKKSKELLDLFGNHDDTDLTEYQSKEILCRHFTIPPFNLDEILQALGQIGCPETVYENGSNEFKGILSYPFNLWLLEKILKFSPHVDIKRISQIRSEVQLLDRFWKQRIENENSERVLRRISSKMVEKRSLNVKVDDIYDDVDLDNPIRRTAWNKLQSDEILAKVSSTGQRIAFSHNILFDYAISVLHIDDEPQQFENFITEDPSRPLFLRPSLTYFFTRLWYYEDSKYFWRAFWHILSSNQSVHLRLVARLIPTSVIANEARNIEQLNQLIQRLQNSEPYADEATTRLFQALQSLQIKRENPWIDFCDQASEYLHVDFAWDLANLTSDILEDTKDTNVENACGRVGRRLLEWVWQERETNESDWYNRFGGRWAVPLVAKTYHTNVEESRALLEKVLQLTQEENFPIGFLTWLTDNVDNICKHDPEFAIQIYLTVFSHQFTSEGETQRGSPILSITTYRSQDFSMCQYRLVKHFHQFLQENPKPATQAAIQSLNCFIAKEYVFRFSRRNMTINELIEPFDFRGKTAYFVKDDSYIWDAQISSDEPIEMANTLFDFMTKLAKSEEQYNLLDSILDVFVDQVYVAFFWKRLLKIASQFPKVFAPRLFKLCIAKPILLHLEVSYELGLFLKNAASEFQSDQLGQIEENILALPVKAKDQENHDYLIMHRDSLIAQIPMKFLSTDEAKSIREKMERENNVPVNRPPITFQVGSETVTEEKWLQEKGVDTTKTENQVMLRFSKSLDEFSSDWRNNVPTKDDIELILPHLDEAYAILKSNTQADEEVINSLWHKVTECAAILGKVSNNLAKDSFAFCRQVLLEGAEHELPKPDPQLDAEFNSPGYGAFPRHEAAEGLLKLAFHEPDSKILDAIEALAKDRVPSVRMVIAMHLALLYVKEPEIFWQILNYRAAHEPNQVVQKYLYYTLTRVVAREKENEDKTTRVMEKLLKQIPLATEKLEPSDSFVNLLMWLTITRQNSWALKKVEDTFFKDPIKYANLLTNAVFQVMKDYVVPKNLETSDGRERIERAINWVSKAITVASDGITELCATLNEQRTDETEKKLHDTYGVIDQVIARLYFEVAHKTFSQSSELTEEIPYDLHCQFYNAVKPLMKQVIDFAQNSESGVMFAPTAHYFMQVLTSFLICNPKEIIHFAERVAKSSERFGYNLDVIAVKDIVDFVEIVLADYRHEVRDDEECLEHLLNLLDLFAKTGQSDALNLVWRLDEVFR